MGAVWRLTEGIMIRGYLALLPRTSTDKATLPAVGHRSRGHRRLRASGREAVLHAEPGSDGNRPDLDAVVPDYQAQELPVRPPLTAYLLESAIDQR